MENNNMVCIAYEFFTDLVRAAERLEILRNAYTTMDRYDIENVMDAIFGIENKHKGGSSE